MVNYSQNPATAEGNNDIIHPNKPVGSDYIYSQDGLLPCASISICYPFID